MKVTKGRCESDSIHGVQENSGVLIDSELKETVVIVERLRNLQFEELRLDFNVYLPNSKFQNSSPGDPALLLQ